MLSEGFERVMGLPPESVALTRDGAPPPLFFSLRLAGASSTSVSLAMTSVVTAVFSVVEAVSFTATGGSLTGFTVTTNESFVLPSAFVARAVMVAVPLAFAVIVSRRVLALGVKEVATSAVLLFEKTE
jgi:hypothetical protein